MLAVVQIYKDCAVTFTITGCGVHFKLSQYFFQRRENEMAEFALRSSAITPFLVFSALKISAWPDALATI